MTTSLACAISHGVPAIRATIRPRAPSAGVTELSGETTAVWFSSIHTPSSLTRPVEIEVHVDFENRRCAESALVDHCPPPAQ